MNSSGLFLNSVTSTPVHGRASGEGWETASGKYSHLLSEASTPNSSTASTPVRRPRNLTLFPPYLRNLGIRSSTPSPLELRPIYEAESPDEIALVETAFSYNCRLLRRTPDSIVVSMPGKMFVIHYGIQSFCYFLPAFSYIIVVLLNNIPCFIMEIFILSFTL